VGHGDAPTNGDRGRGRLRLRLEQRWLEVGEGRRQVGLARQWHKGEERGATTAVVASDAGRPRKSAERRGRPSGPRGNGPAGRK
jgi:hypothetical protein